MSAIHLIVTAAHDDSFQCLNTPNHYESASWYLNVHKVNRLINEHGRIYFHRTKADASFRGGQVTGYRLVYTPEGQERKVFVFLQDDAGVGVQTGLPGWGQEKKYVWG